MSLQCVACTGDEKLKRVFMNGAEQRYESHFLCAVCLQKNARRAEVCHFIDIFAPVTEKEKETVSGFTRKVESKQWRSGKPS